MRWQRMLFLVLAYVLVDLADPFPGAFEFDAEDSVEAVHLARSRAPEREDARNADLARPRRHTLEVSARASAPVRPRRPLTDWLARSRPAHAPSVDLTLASPTEDH